MQRIVVYAPEARMHLEELYTWIADRSGNPRRAETFVSALLDFCETLPVFPFRGVARDDVRPGLRTVGYRRRVVIAFAVDDESIQILGVYYGGRDHETALRQEG